MPKLFEKGNPGKPKGAESKIKKQAKELFLDIMEGEVDHIKEALTEVRKESKAQYLLVLSKFMPYFIAKKVDLNIPGETTIKVIRE
jgi:hypothetical protein